MSSGKGLVLFNVHNIGKYQNVKTDKIVNIKSGRKINQTKESIYYLDRGYRIYLTERQLDKNWRKI